MTYLLLFLPYLFFSPLTLSPPIYFFPSSLFYLSLPISLTASFTFYLLSEKSLLYLLLSFSLPLSASHTLSRNFSLTSNLWEKYQKDRCSFLLPSSLFFSLSTAHDEIKDDNEWNKINLQIRTPLIAKFYGIWHYLINKLSNAIQKFCSSVYDIK